MALALAGGCKKKPTDVPIGVFLPLSGSDSTFGADARDGILLAVEEINEAGGVQGRKVRAIIEDDGSTQAQASAKVRELIERDRVVGLLGEIASSRTIAGAEVANRQKVPLIAPTSTAMDVTRGDFVFRTCFTDAQQGAVAARFARELAGKKKAAVLFVEDDTYSTGLAQTFEEAFTKLGGKVVSKKGYRRTEQSFATDLAELKLAEPDVFFVPVYYGDMIAIAKQARLLKIPTGAFLGGDGWESEALLEGAADELEGAHFTNHYAPDVPWEQAKLFDSAFQAKYGREPTSLAAQSYDATRVLVGALGRAPNGTPLALRDAIAETRNFQGATGVLTIDAEHNANKPVVVVQIKNKKFTYVTQMLSL